MTYNEDTPDHIRERALAALKAGQRAQAVALLEQGLAAHADSADLHNMLGGLLTQAGGHERAEHHFREALRIAPAHIKALANCGVLYYQTGRLDEAAACYRAAIAANPEGIEFHGNLGQILLEQGRFREAEQSLLKALAGNAQASGLHVSMGIVLRALRRHREALGHFEKAASGPQPREQAWFEWVSQLEFLGRTDEAQQILEQALGLFPQSSGLQIAAAKLLRRQKKTQEAVQLLETLRPRIEQGVISSDLYHHELGQLYDSAGRYDEAFACFRKSNEETERRSASLHIDRSALPTRIAACKNAYSRSWVDSWQQALPGTGRSPVFLVGFPRSGTTLLDQILSGHPSVGSSEEMPIMQDIGTRIAAFPGGYPGALASLAGGQIASFRDFFYNAHRSLGGDTEKPVFIDRLPFNMIDAGLIFRLFPDARFILALRHPCDAVLSSYMQMFAVNSATVNMLSLENAAGLYDGMFDLWEQYRSLLPLNVHVFKYEDMIAGFRPSIEGILKFLGLEWHDGVLNHTGTAAGRAVSTASYAQVREAIHDRSVGRWLHYRDHMKAVMPVLAPWAGRYGYAL